MIYCKQLREYVIRPVLHDIGKYSRNAEELLLLTAAQESGLGKYLHQLGDGPAIGIYQMEPATHDDIWSNFLKYKPTLGDTILRWEMPRAFADNNAKEMAGNLYYATAMARCFYLRFYESLPEFADVEGMAKYYKKYYNTHKGKATVKEAIENYNKYVV
ncbi:hypothetical protein [Fodinibius sp. SL11]|uniref:hypothetical protein n=1 Tax=Fodinibius sp. SL11 TaxID=3425690 RepID=UPI003F8830DF